MINLYYDNIIDGTPAPNGTDNITVTDDARQIPCVAKYQPSSPISKFNTFYFVMKAHKVAVKLYTGKPKVTRNLFYPIELNHTPYGWDRNLTNLPSARARQLIQKNKMKLLILAPRITGGSYHVENLKIRIDELIQSGIPKDNIYIVLGELNNVYKTLLDTKHVYSFDWWQVYSQIVFKVRQGQSSLHWISHSDKFLKKANDEILDLDNWQPHKLFNVSTGNGRDHDIALFLEIVNKQLDTQGIFDLNLSKYKLKKQITTSYVDPRKSEIEKHQKLGVIKNIEKYASDRVFDELDYDIKDYNDTFFTIICSDHDISINSSYKQEVASLSTDLRTWQHIVLGHPIAVLGPVDSLAYLNNEGYFTFNEMLNQRYDTIYHPVKRAEEIVKNITEMKTMTNNQLQERVKNIIPFLKANRERFLNKRMEGKFIQLFVDMMYE